MASPTGFSEGDEAPIGDGPYGLGEIPLLVEDEAAMQEDMERRRKQRARAHWEMLRAHVKKGFFHSLLNTRTGATSDFLSLVDRLWILVHRFSAGNRPVALSSLSALATANNAQLTAGGAAGVGGAQGIDSTTEFVMAGWARIKAEQHALERQRARAIDTGMGSLPEKLLSRRDSSSRDPGSMAVDDGENLQDSSNARPQSAGSATMGQDDDGRGTDAYPAAPHARRGLGLDTLFLDAVPNVNITRDLMLISKGLHVQPLGKTCEEPKQSQSEGGF
ncbi:hypothetical protein HKX48_002656 [Thoreauomyces humboldtii]|nr:hypothetical protein HKX48_002656 [Thoreauomyces humboldtii]